MPQDDHPDVGDDSAAVPTRSASAPDSDPLRERIRVAREEDAQTERSIVRFIVGVTLGFIVSTAVMTLGMTLGQMWLFYTGMGMAVVCMGSILLRL